MGQSQARRAGGRGRPAPSPRVLPAERGRSSLDTPGGPRARGWAGACPRLCPTGAHGRSAEGVKPLKTGARALDVGLEQSLGQDPSPRERPSVQQQPGKSRSSVPPTAARLHGEGTPPVLRPEEQLPAAALGRSEPREAPCGAAEPQGSHFSFLIRAEPQRGGGVPAAPSAALPGSLPGPPAVHV